MGHEVRRALVESKMPAALSRGEDDDRQDIHWSLFAGMLVAKHWADLVHSLVLALPWQTWPSWQLLQTSARMR